MFVLQMDMRVRVALLLSASAGLAAMKPHNSVLSAEPAATSTQSIGPLYRSRIRAGEKASFFSAVHADVTLEVTHDAYSGFRCLNWLTAYPGREIQEYCMGCMICKLSLEEGREIHEMSLQERNKTTLPCKVPDQDGFITNEHYKTMASFITDLGPKSIGTVGLGAGMLPSLLQAHYPKVESIDVAEINAATVDIAYRYFALERDERLKVYVINGVDFIYNTSSVDVFVLDASGAQHEFLTPWLLRTMREKTGSGALIQNACCFPQAVLWSVAQYLRMSCLEVRWRDFTIVCLWSAALPENVDAETTAYKGFGKMQTVFILVCALFVVSICLLPLLCVLRSILQKGVQCAQQAGAEAHKREQKAEH